LSWNASSFGHFFPAGYGSIYPALSTLARNGLVEYELVPQDGKPDRKVYSITDKGREALMEGLENPNPSHKGSLGISGHLVVCASDAG
jgi:PadR family transcriptional regulator AphA